MSILGDMLIALGHKLKGTNAPKPVKQPKTYKLPPLCVDCRWNGDNMDQSSITFPDYHRKGESLDDRCYHPTALDMSDRSPSFCSTQRSMDYLCGDWAHHFEPKVVPAESPVPKISPKVGR